MVIVNGMDDERFEAWLVGFSREAQDAARADRARDIAALQEQREQLHAGKPVTNGKSSIQPAFDQLTKYVGKRFREERDASQASVMRFLGERFAEFEEKIEKGVEAWKHDTFKELKDGLLATVQRTVRNSRDADITAIARLEARIDALERSLAKFKAEAESEYRR